MKRLIAAIFFVFGSAFATFGFGQDSFERVRSLHPRSHQLLIDAVKMESEPIGPFAVKDTYRRYTPREAQLVSELHEVWNQINELTGEEERGPGDGVPLREKYSQEELELEIERLHMQRVEITGKLGKAYLAGNLEYLLQDDLKAIEQFAQQTKGTEAGAEADQVQVRLLALIALTKEWAAGRADTVADPATKKDSLP